MTSPRPALASGPDLRLPAASYSAVADYLYSACGIRIREGKDALVISRLGHRVRATGMPSLSAYIDAVIDGEIPQEVPHFIDVLTTNKTGFFRESAHFDFLSDVVLPRLATEAPEIRMWSAACSSGEEPYTLAMTLRDHLPADLQRRTRILATDISNRILATARTGRYSAAQLQDVPADLVKRHFEREAGAGDTFTVRREVREMVRFAHLNLMDAWPMRGPFDVIFCRNVMIYFDRATQERLVNRFADLLPPGGILFVGHAESLSGIPHGMQLLQPAVYRKPGGAA